MMPFAGFDWTDFWDDDAYALEAYICEQPTDELIVSVEAELGYKLPESYIWLMQRHNGGAPANTCFPTETPTSWAEDHVAITGIMGIGRKKAESLCGELGSRFMIEEWGYPPIGVAICDCPSAGHDMIFLDYRDCGPQGEPQVVHVDQEKDYAITVLAENFEAFIRGLVNEAVFAEDAVKEDKPVAIYTNRGPELYTGEEMEAVEQHIKSAFGPIQNVWHEFFSPDIHVDICLIPPAEERPYYTLVTMGMGAHRMRVPEDLAEYELERAELLLALPSDWQVNDSDEQWYWPLRLLKQLARLPGEEDAWLGWGHTIDNGEPYAANTELCTALLVSPVVGSEDAETAQLPGGGEVNFYQVIPLYRGELEYKLANGAEALLDELEDICIVVHPNRPDFSTVEGFGQREALMDNAVWHLSSIQEKQLPVEEITAYNHLAIYLRWCLAHDLMSAAFVEQYAELAARFQIDPSHTDLRPFVRDELKGVLAFHLFNDTGAAFAEYYYGDGDAPYFPADIDDYALQYFGPTRYHSNEFQQEAYLFIPFDEAYYQAMAQVIDRRFALWQGMGKEAVDEEPSELAQALMTYLDCSCRYFPPMLDDDPIMAAYGYASRLGVRKGFVPMLVAVDETLWECLLMNSDEDARDAVFDSRTVAAYREKMLSLTLADGMAVTADLLADRQSEAKEDALDWEDDIIGEVSGGESLDRFGGYWDYSSKSTLPLILAEIPVEQPWQVFAYLPFGGWNECPDTPELMAVAKRWYEQYGAIPAVITHDVLEFRLPQPVGREAAPALALEQYAWCSDIVEQGVGTIGALADTLTKSTVWYFWWD